MLLPLNAAYQFFLASSPNDDHDDQDIERGLREKAPISDDSLDDSNGSGSGGGGSDSRDVFDNDDLGRRDERDEDDDEIIQELEEEEYAQEPRTPRKHRRMPPRFKSISSVKSYLSSKRPTSIWQKIKDVFNTETTPEEMESFIPKYRYMPIISGIVIPLSILLEIPGLTEDWYIRTVANEVVEHRPNTKILDIGLAFSMASAVLANLCLIMRFLEKKVRLMTILCVTFLSIHDVINIIAVTIFGVEHRFDDGFTYGQAFWVTVCSTAVSTFVNVTLIIDLIRTPDFTNSGSGLTRKQRTLVISVMILLAYIALGALVQTFLTDLTFITALYFTVCTIETIGFGDVLPKSVGSKVFTCFYAVFGIINLALTIAMTRETVIEGIEVGYRKRVRAARKRRRNAQYERRVYSRWQAAVEWRLNKKKKPIWIRDRKEHSHSALVMKIRTWWDNFKRDHPGVTLRPRKSEWFNYPRPHGMHLNLEGLTVTELEGAAMEAGVPLTTLLPPDFSVENLPTPDTPPGTETIQLPIPEDHDLPLTYARIGRMVGMLGRFAIAVQASAFTPAAKRPTLPPPPIKIERSHSARSVAEQYESMRRSMAAEEKRAFRARLFVVWIVFFVFWTVGTGIFVATEGWSYGTAFYFCFIAFTTIGYGDFSPKTPAGQSIFVVWALMGVGTMTILISIVSEAYSSRYKKAFLAGNISTAIKRFHRERAKSDSSNTTQPPETSKTLVASPTSLQLDTAATLVGKKEEVSPPHPESIHELNQKVRDHLEALPCEVLKEAKRFKENVRYLTSDHNEGEGAEGDEVPDGLKQLISDIAGVEKLGERIRGEILKDEDARHTLLSISIDQAIRNLITVAEQAVEEMKERDRLVNADNGESLSPVADRSEPDSSPTVRSPQMSRNNLNAGTSTSPE